MKNFKRFLSVILILTMLIPIAVMTSFAEEGVDPEVEVNWKTFALKYSSATMKPILPGGSPRRTGFTFREGPNGEIQVHTPDADINPGTIPTSVVSSRYTTPLADLEVTIKPDDFEFSLDGSLASNNISILWSENPIEKICEKVGDGGTGLYDGTATLSNGLRYLAPPQSKALCVFVNNSYIQYNGTIKASNVNIIYLDGIFSDAYTGHPGYLWRFTARNNPEQTSYSDRSGIVTSFEEIDITNGLTFKIKPDERLGYIVNINGKDYYEGSKVAYFPNDTGWLDDDDYIILTEKYRNSMTFKKEDINLSGLKTVSEGYLSIGVAGNTNIEFTKVDYTIVDINGYPAANWSGDINIPWDIITEPICTTEGLKRRTTETGVQEKVIPPTGHIIEDWTVNSPPDYVYEGSRSGTCTVCGEFETETISRLPLPFVDVYGEQWFDPYIRKVFQEDLMIGRSNYLFKPDSEITRAEVVTILANLDPSFDPEEEEGSLPYLDIEDDAWYLPYIKWAYRNGIIYGIADDTFGPDSFISREEMVLTMYRLAEHLELETDDRADLDNYTDAENISDWAMDSVQWAVYSGLIKGITETTIVPKGNTTRAQFATILTKYLLLFRAV